MNTKLKRVISTVPIYKKCYLCDHFDSSKDTCDVEALGVNCDEEIGKQITKNIEKETIHKIMKRIKESGDVDSLSFEQVSTIVKYIAAED